MNLAYVLTCIRMCIDREICGTVMIVFQPEEYTEDKPKSHVSLVQSVFGLNLASVSCQIISNGADFIYNLENLFLFDHHLQIQENLEGWL